MSPQNNNSQSKSKGDKKEAKSKGAIKLSKEEPQAKKKQKKNDQKLNDGQAGKLLGAFFVVAGLILIGVLLIFYILSKLPYRTDPNMPIPTLEELDEYSNDDSIDLSGEVIPNETVILYREEELTDRKTKSDNDGNFTFEDVNLPEEEKVSFQAATVRGLILKKRSEKSNTVATTVDRTDPSAKVSLDYPKETEDDTITVKGEAEKNSTVTLKKDGEEYETETDDQGKFEVKDVELKDGENVFKVIVEDEAGNEVTSSSRVKVNKKASGDLNGPGATDTRDDANGTGDTTASAEGKGKLPESAGELEAALEVLSQNSLMFGFGVLAALMFALSSFGVYFHNFKKKK
jgi:hypothetical protein